MKVPNSATNLGKAIRRLCKKGEDDIRLARAMADVVVGQMLPEGVVEVVTGDHNFPLYGVKTIK